MLPAYAGMIPVTDTSTEDNERAPRVCGDDPVGEWETLGKIKVLPAYAGMILSSRPAVSSVTRCSPRMRG